MAEEEKPERIDPSDDQEMLDAIAEAFGEGALGLIEDDLGDEGDGVSAAEPLDAVVRKLDQANAVRDGVSPDEQRRSAINADLERFVFFKVGQSLFGLAMSHVLEIQRVPTVTRLPNVPEWIMGVANLRGTVLSVVDPARILGVPAAEDSSTSRRLMVTQSLVDDVETALVVDRVIGIRSVAQTAIEPPTAPVDERVAAFLLGVVEYEDQLVALLDVEKLLLSQDFRQFETV